MKIRIEKRRGYDALIVFKDDQQVAKLYVKETGLISNFYIRKKNRGNFELIKLIADTVKKRYGHLNLFAYASPNDKTKRNALIRLYRFHGFKNVSTNKIQLQ